MRLNENPQYRGSQGQNEGEDSEVNREEWKDTHCQDQASTTCTKLKVSFSLKFAYQLPHQPHPTASPIGGHFMSLLIMTRAMKSYWRILRGEGGRCYDSICTLKSSPWLPRWKKIQGGQLKALTSSSAWLGVQITHCSHRILECYDHDMRALEQTVQICFSGPTARPHSSFRP